MGSYNVSIVKQVNNTTWSNRYVVFADDISAAETAANSILAIERTAHASLVSFVGMKIDNTIIGSPDNKTVGLTGTGSNAEASDYLPLHNTVRVVFHTATGRPSQKYLRAPVFESYQTAGVLTSSTRAWFVTNYAAPLLEIEAFKDVDGQVFTSATVAPLVSLRQLNRRRSSRPGFHRGWVAN